MEVRVSAQEHPDDREISDDDDDRNHKHRRRDDTRLQSLEDDVTEQVFRKPYRRGSKPSQNGHLYRSPGSHSNETWKKYGFNPLEKDKFDKKHPGFTHFNQRIRVNQQFSVDPGTVRGRGRESSLWSQPFSVDPHSIFAGRGSNSRGPSWGPFGLVPGIPNGGLDWFRPTINPSLNMGIARQACRDFEEQGFCLRGDMCPMEHGVNRIVVEDVQSLSQFNLPVSLATANLSIPPAGTGPSPATITTTNMLSNNKDSHGKNSKHLDPSASDFYDPDQPLWGNNDTHNTPVGPQSIIQPNGIPSNDSDHELFVSTSGLPAVGTTPGTRSYAHGTNKKRTELEENMQKGGIGNGRMVRNKASQKAQQTLFVNGIPEKDNRKETLISHFKRFGEVVDVYIPPSSSDRAFVQFCKREEAEAALMAPDAVMGNRFIKLWWANRDNINITPNDSRLTLHNDVTAPASVPGPVAVSGSNHPKPVAANGTKVNPPLQKKLENLEGLKEELRKKQEMLDQKRDDFRRKLDKLAKQATTLKGEMLPEQVTKKQKLGVSADSAATPNSSGCDTILPSPPDDVAVHSSKTVVSSGPQNSKTTLALAVQESPWLKSSVPPWVHVDSPVVTNRFKLDNRPTAFKIVPPLPDGLADVPVLKEHFSPYGDLSKVQLDNIEPLEGNSDPKTRETSAQIYFTTRHAAEKAFVNAKIWKGHNLQFTWLNSNTSKRNLDSCSNQPVVEIRGTGGDLEKRNFEESNQSDLSKP